MNTTVFLFLLFSSTGVLLIIFVFFLRITAAGLSLSQTNDPWKQFQGQFTELFALVDYCGRKYYCLRLPKEVHSRLHYMLVQWQDKLNSLDLNERKKADHLKNMLYQKASSAGIRLSRMYE